LTRIEAPGRDVISGYDHRHVGAICAAWERRSAEHETERPPLALGLAALVDASGAASEVEGLRNGTAI
jgi:hypothetical protein